MSTLDDIAEALAHEARSVTDVMDEDQCILGWYGRGEPHWITFNDDEMKELSRIRDSISESALALARLDRALKERYAARFDMYGIDVRKEIDLD